jgi:hypothetical protein
LTALVAACGGEAAAPGSTGTTGTVTPTLPGAGAAGGSATVGTAGRAAPTTTPTSAGTAPVGTAANPTTVTGATATTAGPATVPCDVADVVSNNCTTCHAATPKFGAPMPLMAQADFQAPAKSDPTKKVYQVMPERLNAVDITRRMPPASGNALPAAGLAALNTWLTGGAQPVATGGCAIHEPTAGTTTMPTSPGGTETPTMGTTAPGNARSGGATDTPQDYNDPMMQCFEFRAHAPGDMKAPYSVSTQPDQYTNFQFMPPWKGMMYARSFQPLDGNAQVIHHWLLYKDSVAVTDGDVGVSTGAHPEGELVHGWAPGGSALYFDPDVGFEMPGDVGYTLETHHNNTTGAAAPDNSGVQVCVTPTVPKNVASLSWLGTDSISGTSASGVCTPTSNVPIQIIGVSPHMHLKGRHMSVILTRANGMQETIHDAPFDFQYQHSYMANFKIMPGDSIKTTCDYSAPTSFGEGTNDEMCYAFTLYYPKLSLTNGNPVATLIHGPNTCLQ